MLRLHYPAFGASLFNVISDVEFESESKYSLIRRLSLMMALM